MEPVTHFLTGACLGRSGANRITRYATLAMVLAAEAPDIDVLWSLGGPVAGFEHHRGITHTFLGAPLMALLVTATVWLWHRRQPRSSAGPARIQPARWGWIWFFALLADLSHLLLDWTNNYGLRPFFPFNPRWYAGSIFFIFEPVLFAALLAAVVMPALFGLADREIGARSQRYRGQGWAIFALCVALLLGAAKWAEHQRALAMLAQQSFHNEAPLRSMVDPFPGSIFEWFGVVETRDFYQTAILNTRTGELSTDDPAEIYYKQPQTPAIVAAKQSWLGRVFLDWSKFPVIEQSAAVEATSSRAPYTAVHFEDLRFAYNALLLHGRRDNPLGGTVLIAPNGMVDEMRMGARVQK